MLINSVGAHWEEPGMLILAGGALFAAAIAGLCRRVFPVLCGDDHGAIVPSSFARGALIIGEKSPIYAGARDTGGYWRLVSPSRIRYRVRQPVLGVPLLLTPPSSPLTILAPLAITLALCPTVCGLWSLSLVIMQGVWLQLTEGVIRQRALGHHNALLIVICFLLAVTGCGPALMWHTWSYSRRMPMVAPTP